MVMDYMIGLFDTGHGGLTIYRALARHLPERNFMYFGDHAHVPYGSKPAADILKLTQLAVERLFERGCPLVVLACNTATAVALRMLQREWLPHSPYKDHRVLGIIAPTVEIAVDTHQQDDAILAVFGTLRTIESNVYDIEIHKRMPEMRVVQQACPHLAGAIEAGCSDAELEQQVHDAVTACLKQSGGKVPQRAILGCTHFPLVEHLFRKALPPQTRLFSQTHAVADRLADYLARHPEFDQREAKKPDVFLTSGDADKVGKDAARFLGIELTFSN